MDPGGLQVSLSAFLPTAKNSGNAVFESFRHRDVYPFMLPASKFLIKHLQPKGFPLVGPGRYENEEKTNMNAVLKSKLHSKITSHPMTTRKTATFLKARKSLIPCPTEYQKNCTELKAFKPAAKPFGFGSERNLNHSKPSYLSPTTYNIDTVRNRKVSHHQSFGKAPIFLPEITIKSTIPQNTDKLYTTSEEQKHHQKLAYLKLYW
ncbi:protein pitchfork isoform X1 [Octopus bimaculoides]|uniref:Uncharacterized protein n=1 Tax=Octopus bimaculoides TaxID=37653 RepID=A0A0L8G5F9_OCTBM|nr:protein pitchfork isoform X1 [Octopus bimaculoides]|eukprot:XP_014784229.1 PREDICTED: protein pitchfork-like isoform X1 [Octopus bimaculoides]